MNSIVSVPGWSGAGYILLDPLTGDGAYKISGGKNGGLVFFLHSLFLFAGIFLALIYGTPLVILGGAALSAITFLPLFGIVLGGFAMSIALKIGLDSGLGQLFCNGAVALLVSFSLAFVVPATAVFATFYAIVFGSFIGAALGVYSTCVPPARQLRQMLLMELKSRRKMPNYGTN